MAWNVGNRPAELHVLLGISDGDRQYPVRRAGPSAWLACESGQLQGRSALTGEATAHSATALSEDHVIRLAGMARRGFTLGVVLGTTASALHHDDEAIGDRREWHALDRPDTRPPL